MDNKVTYLLNGIDLNESDIFVSDSKGLIDLPEQKPTLSFDWAEYDGVFYDDELKPKFKERYISLDMFIRAESWEGIITRFNVIKTQMSKVGTQRLVIKPFGYFPLVYDVKLEGEINLTKKFNRGKMIGVFRLNLIEPIPIKTVIRADDLTVGIKYQSFQQTIINVNGSEHVYEGDVDVSFEFSKLEDNYIVIYGEALNLMLNGGVDITQ